MKRYLVAFFVTIITLVSCSKDLDGDITNDDNAIDEVTTVLTFSSERPSLDISTKTAWDADLNGEGGIVWSNGDKIKIGFTFNGDWWAKTAPYASGNPSPNNKIMFYQSNGVAIDPDRHNIGTFTVPTSFTAPSTSGSFVFYSVYPGSLIENNQNGAPVVDINLHTIQTPAANSFDPATDILVGKSKTITPDEPGFPTETINLYWDRVVAHGNFTLKNFQGVQQGEIITKVVFTAQEGANLTGEQTVSIANGDVTGYRTSNVVTLKGTNLSFVTESGSKNLNVWLSVIPVTLTSLDVVVETNKATYHRSFTGIERTLEGNRRNTMGINMASATRTPKQQQYYWVRRDLAAITSDDVFVIVGHTTATGTASTYAMTNNNADADPVTIYGNKLVEPDTDIQWTLSRSGDNYTFYPSGSTNKWLYCIDDNDGLRVGTGANKAFTLTDNGYFSITYTTSGWFPRQVTRYLGIYRSQDWRCYTSINSYISSQYFTFYVRVDAASYTEYTSTFESGTTFTHQNTDYTNGGSFINTCDGLALTLTNINNSGNTVMYAGSRSSASVSTITTNDAIPEAINSVTLSITQWNKNYYNNLLLVVSPTSDFSSTTEYEFDGFAPGEVWATISAPAANMYYKIVIDMAAGNEDGFFQFDKIIYAE